MRLLAFFLFLGVVPVSATVFGQYAKVSLRVEKASLEKVMDILEQSTDYRFVYQNSQIESVRNLTLDLKDTDIRDVMKECLKGSSLTFNVVGMNVVIVPLKEMPLQQNVKKEKQVKGRVMDKEGLPLPGVSVMIDSTTMGVVTDVNGNYVLTYPEMNNVRLRFSFVGMQTKYVTVGNNTVINVVLEEEINRLDEVVAVGYGTTKAKDMTGAVSRLGKKEIETAPMGASIQSMLQGRAPGVNVMISSASPTSPVSVIIRGSSSLSGDSQPLWVIDGVPEYSAGTSGNISNTLYNLNLTDVETIDILKDASATAIYGSRAANGVVLVTTKRGKKGMKPTLEFSARYGIQTMNANDFGVLNAEEYIALSKASVRASFFTRGSLDYFTRQYIDETKFNAKTNYSQFDLETLTDDLFLEDAYYGADTDWWDLMTHNAATQEYSLGIRGGSKESSYSSSFFYKDQKGIVKGGSSKLLGGSFNFDASIRDVVRFKLGLRATSRVTDDKDGMIGTILNMRPDYPAYTEDGSINMISYYVENPLFTLKNIKEGKGKDFTGSLGLEWDIIPGLTLRTNGTLKYGINKNLTYNRKYYDDGISSSTVSKNETFGLKEKKINSLLPQNLSGYFLKKWTYSTLELFTYTNNMSAMGDSPYPVIRMAELYLIAAEAWNEYLDRPDNRVYDNLNVIRERAGIPTVQESWAMARDKNKVNNQVGMREIIRQEWNIEFAFEGMRYWNLRRWKTAHLELNEKLYGWNILGDTREKFYNNGIPVIVNSNNKFVAPRDYFYPIRSEEILISACVQNIGW